MKLQLLGLGDGGLEVDAMKGTGIVGVAEAGEKMYSVGVALELEGNLQVVLIVHGMGGRTGCGRRSGRLLRRRGRHTTEDVKGRS